MPSLILASTSPYRRELLARLGWEFETRAPLFDEEAWKSRAPTEPVAHAAFLSRGKAESLAGIDGVVIGGDQLVSFEKKILGKPKTFERAVEQLRALSGKTHEIHTGVCVLQGTVVREWVHTTRMQMRKFTHEQIEEYVRRDNPLDCAGSYKFEKQGLLLFEKIECDDFTAIQGLPLLSLAKVLIEFGLVPFDQVSKGSK